MPFHGSATFRSAGPAVLKKTVHRKPKSIMRMQRLILALPTGARTSECSRDAMRRYFLSAFAAANGGPALATHHLPDAPSVFSCRSVTSHTSPFSRASFFDSACFSALFGYSMSSTGFCATAIVFRCPSTSPVCDLG